MAKKPATSEAPETKYDPLEVAKPIPFHVSTGGERTPLGVIGEDKLPDLTEVIEGAAERIAQMPADEDKEALHKAGRMLALRVAESEINAVARTACIAADPKFHAHGKLSAIELKQAASKEVNAICRKWGVAIKHPESGEPCTLLAINTGTEGRYTLENRRTKKRSHATKDLSTLFPLQVVEAE